ncbi:hypothetical protein HPB50_029572 [Hyalomma asiaticum]|nr:hypothetical protein HPB50_029572 [Hyalomma asiaticum]
MRVIDVSEYVHGYDYIHADVKASVLLLCFGKGNENKVYLVEFGLACRYTRNGMLKEDLRKAHDGTIEFASREAHIGGHPRRGDMEILGYNLYQWLLCRQPWEDNLKDPEYISEQKSSLIEDISLLMTECIPRGKIPCCITEFLQYVASVKFEDTPDCKRLKRTFVKRVQAAGCVPDGMLHFTLPRTQRRSSFSPKKPVLQQISLAENSPSDIGDENAVGKPPPAKVSHGSCTASVRKHNCWLPRATKSTSGLGGLVELEHERKAFKKKAVLAV